VSHPVFAERSLLGHRGFAAAWQVVGAAENSGHAAAAELGRNGLKSRFCQKQVFLGMASGVDVRLEPTVSDQAEPLGES
jgi:hypothetical protein